MPLTDVGMAGRIKTICLLFLLVVFATKNGFSEYVAMDEDITEASQALSLITKYHAKYKGMAENNIDNLIKSNPSLEKLMVKGE